MFMNFTIHQDENKLLIKGGKKDITYEIIGTDYPRLEDFSFAIWHLLALAMEGKFDICIDNPIDDLAVENAIKLSEIWEAWQPNKFSTVKIKSNSKNKPEFKAKNGKNFALYSGGVDSSFMLNRRSEDLGISKVLNIHGMDYKIANEDGFKKHIQKTDGFLKKLNLDRMIVKSNANKFINGDHVWGLVLAGHSYLFNSIYDKCYFAADFADYQDFIASPWGTNHVTDKYYKSTNFEFTPESEDYTRSQKINYLSEIPEILEYISFCTNSETKPFNCGYCSKCIRTKLMFKAATGTIPNIFLDLNMNETFLKKIKHKKKVEKAFFIDVYQEIKRQNRESEMSYVVDFIKSKIIKDKNLFTKIFRRGRNKRLESYI